MITSEILKGNAVLKDLTDEQIAAITTLSENDENRVIGDKTREIYTNLDNDIKESTGLDKERGDQKTYDYLKYALTKVKEDNAFEDKYKTASEKIAELEEKVKSGAVDDVIKKENADLKTQLEALRADIGTKTTDWEKKIQEKEAELSNYIVDSEFSKVYGDLPYKDEAVIPKSVREAVLKTAQEKILGKGSLDYIETDNGKMAVIRDANGQLVVNPNNLGKPFSLRELVEQEAQGIIDVGKKKEGTGSGKSNGQKVITLNGATSRKDMLEAAGAQVAKEGLRRFDPGYKERLDAILKENNYESLPMEF